MSNSNKYVKSIKLAPSHIDWIAEQRLINREFGLSRLIRTLLDQHIADAVEVEKNDTNPL